MPVNPSPRTSTITAGLLLLTTVAIASAACSSEDPGDEGQDGAGHDSQAPTSTWTSLGGGLDSNFRNDDESTLTSDNANTLVEGWSFETRGAPTGTPAVVGDRIFATSGGAVYCLQREDGAAVWERDDVGTSSSPTYVDGVLYLHTGDARVMALDASDGTEIWSVLSSDHEAAGGTSSPVVAGDAVIVGLSSGEEGYATEGASFRGGVVAFDIADGAERWRYDTAEPPFNGAAVWSTVSVDLDAGVVYGTTGNNYTGEPGPRSDAIFAISLDRGEELWVTQLTEGDVFTIRNQQGPDHDFGTNPILLQGAIDGTERKLVAAGQKSGFFWVLDREDGEVMWSHKIGFGATAGGILNNGAFDGERLIAAGFPGLSDGEGSEPDNGDSDSSSVLSAMAVDGTVAWERQLPAQVWGPITVANGVAFVPAFLEMHVIDAATGKVLAVFPTEGTIATGAAVADGRAYFGSGMRYGFAGVDNNVLHSIRLPE